MNNQIDGLGIGNRPTGEPDWTFAANANSYTLKKIYILVIYLKYFLLIHLNHFQLYKMDLENFFEDNHVKFLLINI